MLLAIVKLIAGLILLTSGAEGLVRGAAALALRLGVSSLVVGLTVVAFGTSAPELLVCLKSALGGTPSLAVGNAIGSNIFNTGALLGITALIYPITCSLQVIRREVPIMIAVGFFMVGAVVTGFVPFELERWEGIVFLVAFVGYIYYAYRIARRERPEVLQEFEISIGQEEAERMRQKSYARDIAYVIGGSGLLVAGAYLLVGGAVDLARLAGVSELVIGLTIVGAGTGLPELATCVVAAYRRHSDIAVGNVVGSNIFNILLILGTTSAIHPLSIEWAVLVRDLPVMMFLFIISYPLMVTRSRIGRIEGTALLLVYIAYVVYLFMEASAARVTV